MVPPSDDDVVERVIATGGQTVLCCDEQGRVTVDDQPLDEPYLYQDDSRAFGPVTVPAGDLWVRGDHRSNSAGSRDHGPISVDDVIGKASVIVWPFSRFAFLDSPDSPDIQHTTAAGPDGPEIAVLLGSAAAVRRRGLPPPSGGDEGGNRLTARRPGGRRRR